MRRKVACSGGPRAQLAAQEYAKLCRAILSWEDIAHKVDAAKSALRTPFAYIDKTHREQARSTITGALNVVESAFDHFRLTLSQIIFGGVGLTPGKLLDFLPSDQNIINWFYEDHVRARLKSDRYDLVGFSLPAWEQLVPALTLARRMKLNDPDTRFCMGGNFITRLVGTWGDRVHPYCALIDFFSVFEGERSLHQLIEVMEGGGDPATVENLVFANGGRMVHTTVGTVDIDSIPTPNFDDLPLDRYFVPEPILPLFTSRSCPYKCSFCTIPYASSNFRSRSPTNVATDLANLTQKHGTRLYTFVDETLVVPALAGVADEVIDRGLDLYWYGETRFHPRIDTALARRLYRSGCRKLQFGLESANQRVLNLMKKGVKIGYIQPNIRACLSEGIAVHLFTFIGFPGETEHEARQTHEFAQSMLNLSRDHYQNAYSSVGTGEFNLEVYNNPGRYGVQLASPAAGLESDDIFELDYQTDSGLTRPEAARLVRELNQQSAFHDICEKTGRVWWDSLWGNEINEDQDFILYAFAEQNEETTTTERTCAHRYLRDSTSPGSIRLSQEVYTGSFARDFLRTDDEGAGPVIAFYSASQNLAVTLPERVGLEVLALLEAGNLEDELKAAVEQLLRHRLVELEGPAAALSLTAEQISQEPSAQLSFNPEVSMVQLRPQQIELFNVTSQQLLSVNATTAWIASEVRQSPCSVSTLVDTLVQQQPALTSAVCHSVITSLVDAQVLIAKSIA